MKQISTSLYLTIENKNAIMRRSTNVILSRTAEIIFNWDELWPGCVFFEIWRLFSTLNSTINKAATFRFEKFVIVFSLSSDNKYLSLNLDCIVGSSGLLHLPNFAP